MQYHSNCLNFHFHKEHYPKQIVLLRGPIPYPSIRNPPKYDCHNYNYKTICQQNRTFVICKSNVQYLTIFWSFKNQTDSQSIKKLTIRWIHDENEQ